ncbi:MAG: hypothetical protein ACLPWF_27740 [Bryobacteraceae bacterium]
MKVSAVASTAVLFLLPGAIVSAYPQEHAQEKQPEQKQQQAKPAQRQQQAKPAKQSQQAQHQQRAKPAQQPQQAQHQQQAKPAKQPQQAQRQQQAKPAQQPQRAARQHQTKPAQQPQRGQEQQQASRGAQSGGHGSIPEAKFRSSFGSGHRFHVDRGDFANGAGRFQYGGYWFNVVDPWPVGWLYTDDVYVDYLNGGYFLCDPLHPGVYISINIG